MNPTFSRSLRFLQRRLPWLGLAVCWIAPVEGKPLAMNIPAPVRVSACGVGEKWDRYVEYVHRMADWLQTDFIPGAPAASAVRHDGEVLCWVVVNRQGQVSSLLEIEGPDALKEVVRQNLARAVLDHHGFGEWSEMMARDLGEERQVAFNFYFPPPPALPAAISSFSEYP